jgi:hypothetical protein
MASDLKGLGIPLEPRNWFWLKTAAIVIVIVLAAAVAWAEPAFGLPYLVTAILLLPVLLPFLLSTRVRHWEEALGGLGHIGVYAALFAYIALVRLLVAPIVVAALGYAAA